MVPTHPTRVYLGPLELERVLLIRFTLHGVLLGEHSVAEELVGREVEFQREANWVLVHQHCGWNFVHNNYHFANVK